MTTVSRKDLAKAESAHYIAMVAYLKAWVLHALKTGDFGEEFSVRTTGMNYGEDGNTPTGHYELRIPIGPDHEIADLNWPLGVKADLAFWSYAEYSHDVGRLAIFFDAALLSEFPKTRTTILKYISCKIADLTLSQHELSGKKLTMDDLKKRNWGVL